MLFSFIIMVGDVMKKGPMIIFIIVMVVLFALVFNAPKNGGGKNTKNPAGGINIDDKSEKGEEKKDKKISIVMVGDVLIHKSVYLDALKDDGTYDFSKMFEHIAPIIQKYDLRYCNQESTIGGKNLGISAYPGFNSPDEIGDELVKIGFNMVSLANNHSLDKGIQAVTYSNNYWKGKNIIVEGTYNSKEERDNIKINEKNGIKFAFLSYTTFSNGNVPNDYILNIYTKERAAEDIAKAKELGAEVIIVAMHWGTEYTNQETSSQHEIAEYLSSLGVNLIIGSHSHVVEPITYINDTLVIYSLGNFISNQLFLGANEGTGMMVMVDIVVDDTGKVKFENLDYELILSYMENNTGVADNSRNFKVIPYSKLTDELLKNYKSYQEEFEGYVERYMEI